MILRLSKDQRRLVHAALEAHQKSIRKELEEKPPTAMVQELTKDALFQLDLLIGYFDRIAETDCD